MRKIEELLKAAGDTPLPLFYPDDTVRFIYDTVYSKVPDVTLDEELGTGDALLAKLLTFPEVTANEIRNTQVSQELEDEGDYRDVLANLDARGKLMRPFIAGLMALVLFVEIVGYSYLVYLTAISTNQIPSWESLVVPIGIPLTIVWSYFGFLRSERKELIQTIIQNTPVGRGLNRLGSTLQNISKPSN